MKNILLYVFKFIVLGVLFFAYALNKEIGFMPRGLFVFIAFIIGAGVWSINPTKENSSTQDQ